jgi:hypothetical protein
VLVDPEYVKDGKKGDLIWILQLAVCINE